MYYALSWLRLFGRLMYDVSWPIDRVKHRYSGRAKQQKRRLIHETKKGWAQIYLFLFHQCKRYWKINFTKNEERFTLVNDINNQRNHMGAINTMCKAASLMVGCNDGRKHLLILEYSVVSCMATIWKSTN
jgi:hypothetical protein